MFLLLVSYFRLIAGVCATSSLRVNCRSTGCQQWGCLVRGVAELDFWRNCHFTERRLCGRLVQVGGTINTHLLNLQRRKTPVERKVTRRIPAKAQSPGLAVPE